MSYILNHVQRAVLSGNCLIGTRQSLSIVMKYKLQLQTCFPSHLQPDSHLQDGGNQIHFKIIACLMLVLDYVKILLARMGIEPTTFALLARRSNQLS